MKTALTTSLSIVAGLGLVASSPQQASAETIPFTNLPVVTATPKADTPTTAPEKIPAGETTEGIFPAILPEAKRKQSEEQGYRYINVFALGARRQAVRRPTGRRCPVRRSRRASAPASIRAGRSRSACTSTCGPSRTRRPSPPPRRSRCSSSSIAGRRRPQKPVKAEPQKDTVEMIHAERLNQVVRTR